jgi:hypothetical protein
LLLVSVEPETLHGRAVVHAAGGQPGQEGGQSCTPQILPARAHISDAARALLLSTTAWDWELNNEDKLRQPAAVLLDSAGTLRYDYPKAALDTLWGLGLIDAQ